jgi:hypothetical protein
MGRQSKRRESGIEKLKNIDGFGWKKGWICPPSGDKFMVEKRKEVGLI